VALNWGIFSQHFWGEFTQQLQQQFPLEPTMASTQAER
jgi:hypothetical protein